MLIKYNTVKMTQNSVMRSAN